MYKWDAAKNALLTAQRNVSFEELVESITNGGLVALEKHQKRPNQWVYVVLHDGDYWIVPFVFEENGGIFLKTAYRSRKARSLHKKES